MFQRRKRLELGFFDHLGRLCVSEGTVYGPPFGTHSTIPTALKLGVNKGFDTAFFWCVDDVERTVRSTKLQR